METVHRFKFLIDLHYASCANGYGKEKCQDIEIFVQVIDHSYDAIGGAKTCAFCDSYCCTVS